MNAYQLEHRRAIAKWIGKESWNYFITLRPLKTRLTEHNIYKHMSNVFNIDWIKKMFYVLETDRDRMSSHSHIALQTNNILTRESFAKAIKRNPSKEVKYFEQVDDSIGMGWYMSKHIGNEKYVKSYDMLTKDYVLNSQVNEMVNAMHPNHKYHIKNKVMAQLQSGKSLHGNSHLIPKYRY